MEVPSADIYVQQINHREIEQAEYDPSQFYSPDSPFTEIFIISKLKQFSYSSTNPQDSIFSKGHKRALKDYVVRHEKILYFTLGKINFQHKIHDEAEFFFADSFDTLITASLHRQP